MPAINDEIFFLVVVLVFATACGGATRIAQHSNAAKEARVLPRRPQRQQWSVTDQIVIFLATWQVALKFKVMCVNKTL